MGKISERFFRLKCEWYENRIQIQEANIRSAIEKKVSIEEKLEKLSGDENSRVKILKREISHHISSIRAASDSSVTTELKYKYNKFQNRFIVRSVKNVFSFSRKYRFFSRIIRYISLFIALLETGAVTVISILFFLALLPLLLIAYIVYAFIAFTKFKKFSYMLSRCSDHKPLIIIIYSNKDSRILKEKMCIENNLMFSDNSTVLIVPMKSLFLTLTIKRHQDGIFIAHNRFFEYLRSKELLEKETTIIWI